ncbi:MAG: GNAT family N-acetyltransferase [Acidimicrobiales bacterium]|jgi:ribosomal protein S18 acetylase RimI-like enzyme|nr:GNAT family N-acetyltransferase [Acidimicrobiales bacterium]
MTDPRLRPFDPADTDACYEICLRTANNGEDATDLHTDPRIVGEVWVAPYLAHHPECAFVVEDDQGVGGYIVGAPDTAAYDEWADRVWFPPLRERHPAGSFPDSKADGDCVNLIHTPPVMPAEVTSEYPAHLHIDLLPRLQGRGFGKQLMNALFAACREAGADAIHLGCSPENTNAIAFYQHLGFSDLMAGFLWGRSTEAVS